MDVLCNNLHDMAGSDLWVCSATTCVILQGQICRYGLQQPAWFGRVSCEGVGCNGLSDLRHFTSKFAGRKTDTQANLTLWWVSCSAVMGELKGQRKQKLLQAMSRQLRCFHQDHCTKKFHQNHRTDWTTCVCFFVFFPNHRTDLTTCGFFCFFFSNLRTEDNLCVFFFQTTGQTGRPVFFFFFQTTGQTWQPVCFFQTTGQTWQPVLFFFSNHRTELTTCVIPFSNYRADWTTCVILFSNHSAQYVKLLFSI